ncbi:MAG: exosortase/archaeosortase family protein [Candidatus Bathyarchaeia archaeon]
MEAFLGWERLSKLTNHEHGRGMLIAIVASLMLPTLYVSLTLLGLESWIVDLGRGLGVPYETKYIGEWLLVYSWPLSLEYIFFTISFASSTMLMYGVEGMKNFAVSSFFLGAVGSFYMIDTFYPYGSYGTLQWFVPSVVRTTAHLLNSMGYGAELTPIKDGWTILVTGEGGRTFAITVYWPCAGIHSLIIYSLTIVLFLRGVYIPLGRKVAYVLVGAVGTFLVNILRVASICLVGISGGVEVANAFHESYGELYFIGWMFAYVFMIFVIERSVKMKKGQNLRNVSLGCG